MVTPVYLVSHTHWDREWYEPFQTFRMRLVELVDLVLDLIDAEPAFAFTLDGQLATVDDYLEVRPEAEPRIRRAVAGGRLAIGPWQILLDEFLPSGETIVRNLELGTRRGTELGGVMPIGYLPDMFGHVAQMPQILRRAGIQTAVLWRGVPSAVDRHRFTWAAPDGSEVATEYLFGGYGNAAQLFAVPDRADRALGRFLERMAPWFGGDPVLAMLGGDHVLPTAAVVRQVDTLNAVQGSHRVELATLARYVDRTADVDGGPRWAGEMRSGARANVLMGVQSARMWLKAAAARAERGLARAAEPLAALHGDPWPSRLLELAWRRVIDNCAHDSICGCATDEVADQVMVRYAEATQIAEGIAARAVAAAARAVPRGAFAVVNPSPVARTDEVELDLPVDWEAVALQTPDGSPLPTQQLAAVPPLDYRVELDADGALAVFDRMHGRELFGRLLNGCTAELADGRPHLEFSVDVDPDPAVLDVDELRERMTVAVGAHPDARWSVRIAGRPRRRVLARVPVPALGVAAVRPVPASAPAEGVAVDRDGGLGNGLLTVRVAGDGTLAIDGLGAGLVRLVDGGEAGDSYNHAPPDLDRPVDTPVQVQVTVVERGPLRGRLEIASHYAWPVASGPAGRAGATVDVTVVTAVELRAGEPFLRLAVRYDNRAADHRLRLHLPLPAPVTGSYAEGQFAVVRRGLTAEGGYGEAPLPTFPASGFVAVDGLAVLLTQPTEYEVVGGGRELALTVLRAFGRISRNDHPLRMDPAGPEVPTPGAQGLGPQRFACALLPQPGPPGPATLAALERYLHPFRVAPGTGTDGPLTAREGLRVDGEGVVLSALRRIGDELEVRLVNEQDAPVTARLSEVSTARRTDLLGRPGEDLPVAAGTAEIALGPWELATLRLSTPRAGRRGPRG